MRCQTSFRCNKRIIEPLGSSGIGCLKGVFDAKLFEAKISVTFWQLTKKQSQKTDLRIKDSLAPKTLFIMRTDYALYQAA